MYHIHKKGSNNKVLFLFHGTGGDAKEMIFLGTKLDPNASLIAIEGDVKQWRMNRYFIRHEDGSFDLENLASQTKKIYEEILELIKVYKYSDKEIMLIGYSNGANLIQNIFRTYSTNFKKAILFHPSLVRPEVPFQKQPNTVALVTSGVDDPYITGAQFTQLIEAFKKEDIKVKTLNHQFGHALIDEELERAIKLINS